MRIPSTFSKLFLACLLSTCLGTVGLQAQKYCYPSFVNGCAKGDSIVSVTVGTYTRKSGCSGSAIDTAGTIGSGITLFRGKTYSLNVLSGTTDQAYGVWIDFNGDGDFNDGGECLLVDNVLNSTGNLVTKINIPQLATPRTTRMRIISTYVAVQNTTVTPPDACKSFTGGGGEVEDYKVVISAFNNNASVIAIASPQSYDCVNSASLIRLVIANYGSNSITNIPAVFQVGTTVYRDTLKKTLARDAVDTLTFKSKANFSTAGTYAIKAYSNMGSDGDRTNDSFIYGLLINSPPNDPTVTNVNVCGEGRSVLKAISTTTNSSTYWYNNATTDSVAHVGDSFTTPFLRNSSKTYYVQSQYNTNTSLTTTFVGSRANNGNYFDIKAKNTVTIDSFDINMSITGTADVELYRRDGSHIGNEQSSTGWTLVGTQTVNGKGTGNATRLRLGGFKVQSGKTYGILIVTSAGTYMSYDTGSKVYQNKDLEIKTGVSTNGAFSSGITPGRDWCGTTYYHYTTCRSAKKTVTATRRANPSGANLTQGATFQGSFRAGTTANPDGVCVGDIVDYDIMAPTAFTNSTYNTTFKVTNTLTTPKGTAASFTFTAPSSSGNGKIRFSPVTANGDSTFRLRTIFTNIASGCDSTVDRMILVGIKPTSVFTTSGSCISRPFKFNFTGIAGTTSTYTYYFGNGQSATGSKSISYVYPNPGTYTVSLAVVAGGCRDSSTKTVVVSPSATNSTITDGKPFGGVFKAGTLTNPDALCEGDSVRYVLNLSPSLMGTKFGTDWSVSNVSVRTLGNRIVRDTLSRRPKNATSNYTLAIAPKVGVYADTTFVIRITVTTKGNLCDTTLTRYVKVVPQPRPEFYYTPVCVGQFFGFFDSTQGLVGQNVFEWDFGNGQTSFTRNPATTFNAPGAYLVTLKVTNASGCVATKKETVNVYGYPKTSFTVPTGCSNSPLTFIDNSTLNAPGTLYLWRFGDGTTSTLRNPVKVYANSGMFNVRLILTNPGTCKDSLTKTINVTVRPKANVTAVTPCASVAVVFPNTSTNATTYSWSMGDGTLYNTATVTHAYPAPGNYDLTLIAFNTLGCSDTFRRIVKVDGPPRSLFGISDACAGRATLFVDSSTSVGGIASYRYDFGDGRTAGVPNPQVIYTAAGTYNVRLIVTNNNGCRDTFTRKVIVSTLPAPSYTVVDPCVGQTATFNNLTTGSGVTYTWRVDGKAGITQGKNFSTTFTTPGQYKVVLYAKSGGGCSDSFSRIVEARPVPNAKFTVARGGRTLTFTPASTTGVTHRWRFGDGDSAFTSNAVHTYAADGNYLVTAIVTSSNGCVSVDTMTVKVNLTGINNASRGSQLGLGVSPNPSAGNATVHYNLPNASQVQLSITDVNGKSIQVLYNGVGAKGSNVYNLDASALGLTGGVYIIKLQAGADFQLTRLVLVK